LVLTLFVGVSSSMSAARAQSPDERIAHLQETYARLTHEHALAAQSSPQHAELLAEARRNIANTLVALGAEVPATHAVAKLPMDDEVATDGPLLFAQSQQPVENQHVEEHHERDRHRVDQTLIGGPPAAADQASPHYRLPPPRDEDRSPPPPRARGGGRRAFGQFFGPPRTDAPPPPNVDRPSRTDAPLPHSDQSFHIRAAAHHLKMAGMDAAAVRVLAQSSRDADPGPQRGADGNRDTVNADAQLPRAVRIERQRREVQTRELEERMNRLESHLEESVGDLSDRIQEMESIVERIQRQAEQAAAIRDALPPAEHVNEMESQLEPQERNVRETVRLLQELLQGRSDATNDEVDNVSADTPPPESIPEHAQRLIESLEAELDHLREVNARQAEQRRQILEQFRTRNRASGRSGNSERQRRSRQRARETEEAIPEAARKIRQQAAELRRQLEQQRRDAQRSNDASPDPTPADDN
jgi:ribosomal protein S15P/S13E